MMKKEQLQQFNEILEELGKTLDISETQYNAAVQSYLAVGDWLSKEDSELAPYKPIIRPQGSFMLGTMIKPIVETDDLDIDLVCELTGKNPNWTQSHVKKIVGLRIQANETYKNMLQIEGRRCWTLAYRKDSENIKERYHMDILPSIISDGFSIILEKAFSDSGNEKVEVDKLAIRITDKEAFNYFTAINVEEWLKSNPFGYGQWFYNRASTNLNKSFSLTESVKPVPKYQTQKLPLQRIVQILKRHRDMMFNGDEDKPISIIITTLATRAYNKETNIVDGLIAVIDKMPLFIEERYDVYNRRYIKWVSNPVNDEENFADKWVEHPQKERNFYKWMDAVKQDVKNVINQQDRGLQSISESLVKPFGKDVVTKAFSNYAQNARILREQGLMKMESGTGMLGSVGNIIVKNHTFDGKTE